MKYQTVDVICSLETGFPIMLEVIDTEDIEYSLERQRYYKQYYEKVHLFVGVDIIEQKSRIV